MARPKLLTGSVSASAGERLYRESGGNPFFLLQLARGVTLSGQRAQARISDLSILPESVQAALTTELSSIGTFAGAAPGCSRRR